MGVTHIRTREHSFYLDDDEEIQIVVINTDTVTEAKKRVTEWLKKHKLG